MCKKELGRAVRLGLFIFVGMFSAAFAKGEEEIVTEPIDTARTVETGTVLHVISATTGTGVITVKEGGSLIFETVQADALTVSNDVILQGGTLAFCGAGEITCGGHLSGAGSVVMRGTGELVMSQASCSGFTAATLSLESGSLSKGCLPRLSGSGTIDLVGAGLRILSGAFAAIEPGGSRATLLQFLITRIRYSDKAMADAASISELYLYQGGKRLSWPAGTVTTSPGAPATCANTTDGDIATEWYTSSSYHLKPLFIDLGSEIRFDAMSYVTSNHATFDPISWTLARGTVSGSVTNWEVLVSTDRVTDSIPTANKVETPLFACTKDGAFANGTPVSVAAAASLTVKSGVALHVSPGDTGTGAITVEKGATLIYDSSRLNANGTTVADAGSGFRIDNDIVLAGGELVFCGNGETTCPGALSGSGEVAKRGTGGLVLSHASCAGLVGTSLSLEAGAFAWEGLPNLTGCGTIDLTGDGLNILDGSVVADEPNGCRATLLRFLINRIRRSDPSMADAGSIAELYVNLDGRRVVWPAGTVAAASAGAPASAIDGDVETSWYTSSGYDSKPLYVDLGSEVRFDSMSYVTCANWKTFDPISWTLSRGTVVGSTTNWETLVSTDRVTDSIPLERKVETPKFACSKEDALVVPANFPVAVSAGASLTIGSLHATLGNLQCKGALVLTNGAELTLAAGTHELQRLETSEGGALYCEDGAVFSGKSVFAADPRLTETFSHFCIRPYWSASDGYRKAISEIELWYNGAKVVWPAGTVCHIGDVYTNGNQGPDMMIDGSVETQMYGTNYTEENPIQIDLGAPVRADSFRWSYGNANETYTDRNLVWWKAFVSADGTTWREVHSMPTRQPLPAKYNKTFSPYWWFYGISNAVETTTHTPAETALVDYADTADFEWHAIDETLVGLSGGRSVYLARGILRLDVADGTVAESAASFSGAGDIVKSGDGTQVLGGTLGATGRLVVESGTLDLSGATLSGVTNIVLAGGVLKGTGSVPGDLTVTCAGGRYAASLAVSGALRVTGNLVVDAGSPSAPCELPLFTFGSTDDATRETMRAFTVDPALDPSLKARMARRTNAFVCRIVPANLGILLIVR